MEAANPDRISGCFGYAFSSNFEGGQGGQGSFSVIALRKEGRTTLYVTTWSEPLMSERLGSNPNSRKHMYCAYAVLGKKKDLADER
jgi:hypothetical protein